MPYTSSLSDHGDLLTIEEFREDVRDGYLIDYDGTGHPVKDGKMDRDFTVFPSLVDQIPADATHVMWYNR